MRTSGIQCRVVLAILIIWFITANVIAAEENSAGYFVTDSRNFEDNYRLYVSPALETAIALEIANRDKTLNVIAWQEKSLSTRKSTSASLVTSGSVCSDLDYSKVTGKGAAIKGETIVFTPDGNTLVFSPDGSQRCHTGSVTSPDQVKFTGSAASGSQTIIVPSGSSIRSVENRYYVTRNGDLLLTVIDNSGQNLKINSVSSNAALTADGAWSWIEWAEDTSISRIRYFTAVWRVPHSPDLADFSSANMVWNGIDGSNHEGLIQPVAAFNYYEHGSSARNRWTGAAWGVKEPAKFTSTPIPLNEGDEIRGSMLWIPVLNEWLVVLIDQTTGQFTYHFTDATIRTPLDNLEAYVVYEGSGIAFDNQKSGDTPFYSMSFLNSYYLPVTPSWVPKINPLNSAWHPYVHGLYVDTSSAPSRVVLLTSKKYIITASAGDHGSISPSEVTEVLSGDSQTFTITPEPGYTIDELFVDGLPVMPPLNSYTFSDVIADHTIAATFRPDQHPSPPLSVSWTSMGDWNGWSHSAVWTGPIVGSCSEYGPAVVNSHGEHGADVHLNAGSVTSTVERTFTAPSGDGWNTVTLVGRVPGSDTPAGRWMKMYVNDNLVFSGSGYSSSDPANVNPITVTGSFPISRTATIKIMNGQNPAWGVRFFMEYYSLELTSDPAAKIAKNSISAREPDAGSLITNTTQSAVEAPTTDPIIR